MTVSMLFGCELLELSPECAILGSMMDVSLQESYSSSKYINLGTQVETAAVVFVVDLLFLCRLVGVSVGLICL